MHDDHQRLSFIGRKPDMTTVDGLLHREIVSVIRGTDIPMSVLARVLRRKAEEIEALSPCAA
jgi:hypothetical protein